jgi:hypothetical protein
MRSQSAGFASTSGVRCSKSFSLTNPADVSAPVEWIGSVQLCDVVGVAQDGGFYVHASLHPFGAQAALDRSGDEGVTGQKHKGELYFPAPWIRAELSAVLKHRAVIASTSTQDRALVVLTKTLPMLFKRANEAR